MKSRRPVIVAAVAFLVAGALALRWTPIGPALHDFEAYTAHLGAWGMVVYAVGYVVAVLLFVPGSVLTIGAGLVFGFWKGMLVVSVASTMAAAVAFLIARHLAREAVERRVQQSRRFGAIDRAVREKGALVVFLLRLSPLVPFSLSNYLYGLTAVSFGRYVLASWIGMLPGTALYVYLGSAGRVIGEKKTPGEWALLAAGLVATALVSVVVARAAKQELARTAVD